MEFESHPASGSIKDVHELYRGCSSADPDECSAAFQELGRYLLRIAYSRMKNHPHLAHVAEDCAQQALVIVWQKLRDSKGPDRVEWFLTWCASIVIHLVLDEFRKTTRSYIESLDELAENDESFLSPPTSPKAAAPADYTFETADDRSQFVALIQNHSQLSTDTKLVLLHGYLLEQDDQELARQLGKSRATVRVLRFRGLRTLRDDQEFMNELMSLTLAEPTRLSVVRSA